MTKEKINMSAEEFYTNLFNLDFMTEEERQTIFKSTELYSIGVAKQEAIGFAEWIRKGGYDYAAYTDGTEVYWDDKTNQSYSTDELYIIYQQQKENK